MWKVVETFFSKSLSHSRPFRRCVRIFVGSINFSKSNIANFICRSSDPNVEVCLASRPPLHQLAPVSRHMSKASAGARQAAHNTPGGAGLCSQHRFYMSQNMSDTLQIQCPPSCYHEQRSSSKAKGSAKRNTVNNTFERDDTLIHHMCVLLSYIQHHTCVLWVETFPQYTNAKHDS